MEAQQKNTTDALIYIKTQVSSKKKKKKKKRVTACVV